MGKSFPLFKQEYGTIRRRNYEGGNRVGFRYKVILSYDGTNYVAESGRIDNKGQIM